MSASPARLLQLLTPAVAATGNEVEDLSVSPAGKRSVVRVLVDRDGGITLDDVAEASRAISEVLDGAEADLFDGAYVLEVSSPGVDRPLTEARHWRRNAGRLVKVTPVEGAPFVGRVLGSDDVEVTLDVEGAERTVLYASLTKALVQVEFNREDEA